MGWFIDDVCQYYPRNPDHNSGDLLGVGISQVAAFEGRRATASAAFLSDVPSNLTIMTEAAVERVLFEGRQAVGIKVADKICKRILHAV